MKRTTPCSPHRHKHFTCLLLFSLLFLITSINAVRLQKQKKGVVDRKRVATRAMIGSSPPRCMNNNRCPTCRHCEAVQVPVLPENKNGVERYLFPKRINYRGESGDDEYDSNYKPMGWMCKCGDLLFIP